MIIITKGGEYNMCTAEPNSIQINREKLKNLIWTGANILRDKVDYSLILLVVLYKAISDRIKYELDKYGELLVNEELTPLRDYTWDKLLDEPDPIKRATLFKEGLYRLEKINKSFKGLVKAYSDYLDDIDKNTEDILQLIDLFAPYDFSQVQNDVIGDAYEEIIHKFALEKGKGGEVYTPKEIIELMLYIIQPEPINTIYDPACGTAGMLVNAHKYLTHKYGDEAARADFYGQEINSKTASFAMLNGYIHGIDTQKLHIKNGDTLKEPAFEDKNGNLKTFDVVIANPPWSLKRNLEESYKQNKLKHPERFKYGFPPGNSADWAWVQHMIASSNGKKRIGLVIDPGMLTRGKKEFLIRKQIIEDDLIESVILLPSGLFYHSQGLIGVIVIFNKNKTPERKGKIMFINASEYYEQHPEVRKLNRLTNIEEIAELIHNWEEKPYVSRIVSIEEICKEVKDAEQEILEKQKEVQLIESRIKKIQSETKRLKKQIKKKTKTNKEQIKKEIERLQKEKEELSKKKKQLKSSIKIDNGCSLSVLKYVPPKPEEDNIDAVAVWEEIQEINNKIAEHEKFISKIVDAFFKGEDKHV